MFNEFWTNLWILVSASSRDHNHDDNRIRSQHRCNPHYIRARRMTKCVQSPSSSSSTLNNQQRVIISCLILVILGQLCHIGHSSASSSFKRRITGTNGGKSLQEWDDIFQQRTDDDWRVLWHKEHHRRCQHQLLSHMELVCEKDIYKLARRRKKRDLVVGDELEMMGGGGGGGGDTQIDQPPTDQDQQATDSESDELSGSATTLPNGTRPLVHLEYPKHPLFSTFKEANIFGRRQLFRGQRKRSGGFPSYSSVKRSYPTHIDRAKRGISDECCSGPDGCSWEEYAEYCPANVRVRIANPQ